MKREKENKDEKERNCSNKKTEKNKQIRDGAKKNILKTQNQEQRIKVGNIRRWWQNIDEKNEKQERKHYEKGG